MSWLSEVKNALVGAFDNAVKVGGAPSQPAAATATANIAQAANLLQGSMTDLVNIAVNAVLGVLPQGAQFAPLADELIDEVIAGLMAKKAAAPAPVAAPVAAEQPAA